ncbi:MAG: homoserine O-acetyltransferase [Flavobacteriales bacterium]|nr:homoserine O-acetyltransferase [Flavobacteriales bacterium]
MTEKIYTYPNNFDLESGKTLGSIELNYTTYGTLNESQSNVVWVCHALTGNSNPASWWGGLIGDNRLFDPYDKFIVCVNALGSCYGSTGPLSINPETGKPYFGSFPRLTIRDIVRSLELLRKQLKIASIETLIGGSLGGQQAIEWSILHPNLIRNLVLIATNAKHSSWGIAFNESQRMAIESDSTWGSNAIDAGQKGLVVARSIALLSYRNYKTYQKTQLDDNQKIDNYSASSYQKYQGEKFVKRFNAYSYWILSKAMDSHDISRNRGTIQEALAQITAKTIVVGITTDILFPIGESRILAEGIKNSELLMVDSDYGHDGFLLETTTLSKLLKERINEQVLTIAS